MHHLLKVSDFCNFSVEYQYNDRGYPKTKRDLCFDYSGPYFPSRLIPSLHSAFSTTYTVHVYKYQLLDSGLIGK